VTFIGDYRKADDDCCAEVTGSIPAGPTQAAFLSLLRGSSCGRRDPPGPHNLVTATEEEAWGLSAQADWISAARPDLDYGLPRLGRRRDPRGRLARSTSCLRR